MKKNVLRVLALAVLMCLFTVFVSAEEVKPVYVMLNGEYVDCASYGQEATIVEGRTMVPLRAIFEALGATVEWNQETKTVSSVLGDTEISLTIGENKLIKNGEEIVLDVPALIMNGRTLVPVRAVSESFGVYVEWDANTRTVVLTKAVESLEEKPETPVIAENEENVPEEAKEILTKAFDAMLSLELNEAAKYSTNPEVVSSLNISGIDDLLSAMGYDRDALAAAFLNASESDSETYLAFSEAVADISIDVIKGTFGKMDYEILSYNVVSEDRIDFEYLTYVPDMETFDEDFGYLLNTVIESATYELMYTVENIESKTEKEIYDLLAPLMRKHAEPLVAEFVNSIGVYTDGEASSGTLVKVNGTWLVEVTEEDIEGFESLKNNGFGIVG